MNDVVIEVKNLSKKYRLGGRRKAGIDTLRERLVKFPSNVSRFFTGGKDPTHENRELWALRDVSFSVERGRKIGVIGRNGAGKSTLLKVLSQITPPTEGEFMMKGQAASLLEVGTGFHPELTGRENIFLNGAVLGMTKRQIEKRFDDIVDFAEVESFLDTPVKRYSSGMYVRLAFAVAAHLEPDILLVDEVLAVGDAAFQRKCLGKMNEVAKAGRTVLLVSHNMLTVESVCDCALWLHDGRIKASGETSEVVSSYLSSSFSSRTERNWENLDTAPGDGNVKVRGIRVFPEGGMAGEPIRVDDSFVVEFFFQCLKPNLRLDAGIQLHNEHGVMIFDSTPIERPEWLDGPLPVGTFKYTCHVPGNLLNNGMHRVVLWVVKDSNNLIVHEDDALLFEIADSMTNRTGWHGHWDGAIRPVLDWTVEKVIE